MTPRLFFSRSCLLNLYLVIFLLAPSWFSNSSPYPTHTLPRNVCRKRSIKQSMTQIDVMRFGKFKALANYTKVGKHTHMKHLFVGAWNLSAGLSCLKNFNLNNAPKFPLSVLALCQAAFPKFHHLASPLYLSNALSNTNKLCSSVLQGSLLLSLVTK